MVRNIGTKSFNSAATDQNLLLIFHQKVLTIYKSNFKLNYKIHC